MAIETITSIATLCQGREWSAVGGGNDCRPDLFDVVCSDGRVWTVLLRIHNAVKNCSGCHSLPDDCLSRSGHCNRTKDDRVRQSCRHRLSDLTGPGKCKRENYL